VAISGCVRLVTSAATSRPSLLDCRIIRRREEHGFDLLHQFPVCLRFTGGLLPLGITAESCVRFLRSVTALVGENVNQRILRSLFFVLRNPETNKLDSVLLEQPAGVVAETLVQILQLPGHRVIGTHLETARILGDGQADGRGIGFSGLSAGECYSQNDGGKECFHGFELNRSVSLSACAVNDKKRVSQRDIVNGPTFSNHAAP